MKIYSTRHGQTDYNMKDLILGTTDLELNDSGIMQATELANLIKNSNEIIIDKIISSPMTRALKTAEIISDINNVPVITDDRLCEWNYGNYEGMHCTAEGFAENKRQFAVRMGRNGESLLMLSHRVYSAIDDIIRHESANNILIVSHGGICRVIETYFKNMTTEQYSSWFMKNCQLLEYNLQ